ncbi:MAG TPA: aminoglycoside phosphotransferase family protein [Thermoanaerobaculia bacterium]|jgi:aminoglycoside phosphotransferase (APT) family kinase protein|nr:aminoglycoside phosphotransferase family protein [Thermoanaerobaculia bacterium]
MTEPEALSQPPDPDRLAAAIRRHLGLRDKDRVSLEEVGELSNINYVYRVETPTRSLYLKAVPERPKRLPIKLPRERVFSEAEGLRTFGALAGDDLVVPEVLFVDGEEMALAMSDVGDGREILFNALPYSLHLITEHAEALGRALGNVHAGTHGKGSPRPAQEEAIIRKVVFDGLLGPGAKQVFPEHWDAVNAEMQQHRECLVHGDLWSKNLLVRRGAPIAVVDFEGVTYGDPAFDLGTLAAVVMLPALETPALMPEALDFIGKLLQSWSSACGSKSWARDVRPRTFRAIATFLAARGFGPFAYSMSEAARNRIRDLARALAANPPATYEAFRACVNSEALSEIAS